MIATKKTTTKKAPAKKPAPPATEVAPPYPGYEPYDVVQVFDDGTRPVLVELANPSPLAGAWDLAKWILPCSARLPAIRTTIPTPEPVADDWATRMDELEHALIALEPPEGPVRIDLARGFALTVTPSILRRITHIPQVGVIRPRQVVQRA